MEHIPELNVSKNIFCKKQPAKCAANLGTKGSVESRFVGRAEGFSDFLFPPKSSGLRYLIINSA